MSKIIAITGNIGSGKTSLTQVLASEFGWKVQLEDVMKNPYIKDFYDDMHRWSFNMQVYYLKARFHQMIKNKNDKGYIIQDRTIYEDVNVFAPVLHVMGLMSHRDFNTYKELFSIINSFLNPPNLLIYIRSSVKNLLRQIKLRKRSFESSVSKDYLQRLNERYEVWIHNCTSPNLIVDVDELDFINNSSHLETVIGHVRKFQKDGIL